MCQDDIAVPVPPRGSREDNKYRANEIVVLHESGQITGQEAKLPLLPCLGVAVDLCLISPHFPAVVELDPLDAPRSKTARRCQCWLFRLPIPCTFMYGMLSANGHIHSNNTAFCTSRKLTSTL